MAVLTDTEHNPAVLAGITGNCSEAQPQNSYPAFDLAAQETTSTAKAVAISYTDLLSKNDCPELRGIPPQDAGCSDAGATVGGHLGEDLR